MTAGREVGSVRIGEVAKRAGVTVETIRYYTREGLLPSPLRSTNGARRFPLDAIARVQFVRQAQAAGLTLRDIKHLVGLTRGRSRLACHRMRTVLAQRLDDLDARAREIAVFRATLENHLAACDRALSTSPEPECPSLEALDHAHRAAPSSRGCL